MTRPEIERALAKECELLRGLESSIRKLRGVVLDRGAFTGNFVRFELSAETWDAVRDALAALDAYRKGEGK